MIVSEKSHKNLSEYNHFLCRKIFKFNKIGIISINLENFMRKIESFQGGPPKKKLNSLLMLRF